MLKAALFSFISVLYSGGIFGEWNHYTSLLTPTDVVIQDDDRIYAATIGGLLELNTETNKFNFITSNYLEYLDLSSMINDSFQNLILGGNPPDRTIQIFHNEFGLRNTINNLGEVDKILKFELNEPYLFAAYKSDASYGILKFLYNEFGVPEYQDFYNNFPEQFTNISDIDLMNDTVFVTTPEGIFYGNYITENLKSSDNWKSMSIPIELPMVFYPDSSGYFIGGYNELWRKINENWEVLELEIDTELSTDFQALDIAGIGNNSVGILTKKQYFQLENSETVTTEFEFSIPVNTDFTAFDYLENTAAFGMKHHGILMLDVDSNSYEIYVPDTPIHNQYDAIEVLGNGSLVGVCNRNEVDEYNISDEIGGVTIFENEGFINYISSMSNSYWEYPVNVSEFNYFTGIEIDYRPGANDTWSIIESESGNLLVSNSGNRPNLDQGKGGVIELNLNTNEAIIYDTTNNVLDGLDGIYRNIWTTRYLTINQLNKDPEGNIWVMNPYSEVYNLPAAIQLSDGQTWSHISAQDELSYMPQEIAFDQTELAWFGFQYVLNWAGTAVYSDGGLKVLDTKGTYGNPTDDTWLNLTNPEILPNGKNTSIWSLTSDNLNRIWVLTSFGVQGYIFSRYGNSISLMPLYTDIEGELFNYLSFLNLNQGDRIRVDSQNNIWISTRNSGVWFIPEDTPPWEDLTQYSTETSPILSNIVYDMAFDHTDGTVYFATEKGISYLTLPINSVKKNADNQIRISPNPLRLPDDSYAEIYDIYPGSTVKIMQLSGEVVRSLNSNVISQNDTAVQWDGRNSSGEYVGSGVYLVAVSHPEGGNAVSKIAVIRQ